MDPKITVSTILDLIAMLALVGFWAIVWPPATLLVVAGAALATSWRMNT